MHVYDIYRHPQLGLQAVRRGFSWSAFLLPSVWAVRRRLGMTTLLLVAATTMMFDLARVAVAQVPGMPWQLFALLALVTLVGWRPGHEGWQWHARRLRDEHFEFQCTVLADSRRQALNAAANDDWFEAPVRVAAA